MIVALSCPGKETIMAFAEGRLAPDDFAGVHAHALTCALCRDLLVAAMATGQLTQSLVQEVAIAAKAGQPTRAPAPFSLSARVGSLGRGDQIGRYTILAPTGHGGMGEVYAAFDAELDRKIALKLLRVDGDGDGDGDPARASARLLFEAKALAKLSHPNVVTVHDVGTFEGRVFIAMEFVDGVTLADWLAAERRAPRDIVAMFLKAAAGLAAAHAAGLVHRDFKPTNVMVRRDGSVRVMDFGLARSSAPRDDLDAAEARDASSKRHLDLTRTGELLGTPLYMAPEQFRGEAPDARTDQFSFCVALYRALYGVAPFKADTLVGLTANVLGGRLEPAPPKSAVPGWIRRALIRGLSVDRAARWSSIQELVVELKRDPARARRRWAAAITLGALVISSVLVIARGTVRDAPLCRGGPARLVGVWESSDDPSSSGRRSAVRSAFIASGTPGARDVWERVAAALDRYRADWLTMYRDACESAQVRHEQSARLLELRMGCLDERRTALNALTKIFASADREVVRGAVDAVNALPALGRCADRKQLEAIVEPIHDEQTRRRVAQHREQLAVAKALNDTGKHAQAMAVARAELPDVRALGYRPLLADTLMIQFRSFAGSNFRPEAVSVGEEVVWTSLAIGRDDLAAEAAIELAPEVGGFLDRYDEGRKWAHLARALLDRAGEGHDLLRSWLATNESFVELKRNPQKALELSLSATAIKQRILPPDHPDIANDFLNRAEALAGLNRFEDALRANTTAYDTYVAAYGPASVEAAHALSNRGEYLIALGRPAEALDVLHRALANWEAQIGPDHEFLAYPLTALGRALLALRRPNEALPPLQRAIRILEHVGDKSILAEPRFTLARALWDAGSGHHRARELAQEARAGFANADDASHLAAVDAWLGSHSVEGSTRRR